jgi:hypothetical protein
MAALRLPPAGPVTHRRQAYLQFFFHLQKVTADAMP